jgi:hypothetical protein
MYSIRYSCQIEWKLHYLDVFSKNTSISNLMEILPVGAELFHADRHGEADGRF